MAGRAEEREILSIPACPLEERNQVGTLRHFAQEFPVVLVAFEVIPHGGFMLAVGKSGIVEIVLGAAGEESYRQTRHRNIENLFHLSNN